MLHCQSKRKIHSEEMEDVLLCYQNGASTPFLAWQIMRFMTITMHISAFLLLPLNN